MIKIIMFLCITLAVVKAKAQEVNISTGLGVQGLNVIIPNGKNTIKVGGNLAIDYTYFINNRWGVITGLGVNYFKNQIQLANQTNTSMQEDSEGEVFEYRIKTFGYQENSHFFAASIPLMLHFQTKSQTQFYMNGGTKVILPLNQKTNTTADQVQLTGYYDAYHVEFTNLPQHGFGTIDDWNQSKTIKLKPTITLSAETGAVFPISNKMKLFTGIYFDYGLTHMVKDQNQPSPGALITYNPNGIEFSSPNGAVTMRGVVDQSKLLAFGVQIKLILGSYKRRAVVPLNLEPLLYSSLQHIAAEVITTDTLLINRPFIAIAQTGYVEELEESMDSEKSFTFKGLGKTSISKDLMGYLDRVIRVLESDPLKKIHIAGHSCDLGNQERNLMVGRVRAMTVAEYLQSKGVASEQIITLSKGASESIDEGKRKKNCEKNKRVSIVLKE